MANLIFPFTRQQFFDNTGLPLAYGLVTTYAAGTTTPVATYNATGAVNPNPLTLDFRGQCDLWGVINQAYKVLVQDSAGNAIPGYPLDNILLNPVASSGTFTATGVGFTNAISFPCSYTIVANVATVSIGGVVGVSNSTGFSLTGIPNALQPPTTQQQPLLGVGSDNGSTVNPVYAFVGALQSTWILAYGASVAWTASGQKGLSGNCVFSYLLT